MQLQLLDESGEVAGEFGIYDSIEPAVAILTELFGAEPVVTMHEGNVAADYQWEGFAIATDGPAAPPTHAGVYFRATATEVNGIRIETRDGYSVGDALVPLSESVPENSHLWDNQGVPELVVSVDETEIDPAEPDRAFHTELVAHPSDGPITRIAAPAKNFE
jgi:hypothetical protein